MQDLCGVCFLEGLLFIKEATTIQHTSLFIAE